MRRRPLRALTLAEVLVSSGLLLGLSLLLVLIHRSSIARERGLDQRSQFRRSFAIAFSNIRREISGARILEPGPSSESNVLIYLTPRKGEESPLDSQGLVQRPVELIFRLEGEQLVRELDGKSTEMCNIGSKGALRFNRIGNRILEVEIKAGNDTVPPRTLRTTWFLKNQP